MRTALLPIDAQRNMLEGDLPVPQAEQMRLTLETLLARARAAGVPVVQVQNDGGAGDPDEPFTRGWEMVLAQVPGEIVVRKRVNDAFLETDLASQLKDLRVTDVSLAGMQRKFCIEATSRGALEHGFAVTLAAGAHTTYDSGQSAQEIAQGVEESLLTTGVRAVPFAEVQFR